MARAVVALFAVYLLDDAVAAESRLDAAGRAHARRRHVVDVGVDVEAVVASFRRASSSLSSPQYGPSLQLVVHLPYVLPRRRDVQPAPRSHCSVPATIPSPQIGVQTLGWLLKPLIVSWKFEPVTWRSALNTAIS